MSRIARIVRIGYPHHIVQRGNNRSPIFFEDADRYRFLRFLKKYSYECHCVIHVFCLMPNHVHFLATPEKKDCLAKMMQKVSLSYTQYVNDKYERTGRLWECRFHSCVVDDDNYLLNVCRYIERNPVRAKLVKKPVNYKWSSVRISTGLVKKESFIKPIFRDRRKQACYADFLNDESDPDQEDMIRKVTGNGKPYGSREFVKPLKTVYPENLPTSRRRSGGRGGR